MTDSNQLLCDYVRTGSEPAFQELVGRYVNLVYSVALRRVGGDEHQARDVVQTVFTDFARKASRLRSESSLGGWLHRHTCFVSSNLRRTEQRRMARERVAMEMNQLNEPTDAAWQQLAPVLDDAIDALADADRKAIVLRFYERRDLRDIGQVFGTSEDAAQKRVSRALEKLRTVLMARGVQLGIGVLASLLASRAVSAAPAGLAAQVGANALTGAGGTGLLATVSFIMTSWSVKLGIGVAAAALVAGALLYTTQSGRKDASQPPAAKMAAVEPLAAASPETTVGAPASETAPDPASVGSSAATSDALRLTILAADSGQPIPGVQVNYRGWEKEKFSRKQFVSNRSGVCDVFLPRATITQLELTCATEGFADTRLEWRTDRGESIPPAYTLRLTRPVRIAGRVIDADGQPVAGAKVGWNHQEDGALDTRPESHAFGWIEVETNSDGRWQVNRIAPDMLRRLYGTPQHPEHIAPPLLMVSENRAAEEQLRTGTHVFQMGRALSVTGRVVDPDGKSVPNASVYAGGVGESGRRSSTSAADGGFVVNGCRPGKNLITAEADGFTASTVEVNVSDGIAPITIKLQRGKTLRLRLVDKAGQPIPGANVWYNTFRNRPVNEAKPDAPPPAQVEFSPKTDGEGRVVWESAPEGELTFSFAKQGFMRQDDVRVDADGQEHVITLAPALVVSGTVVDAATGQPIPRFRIACGWPSPDINGKIQARFSNIDRFWLSFAEGKFRHAFDEPLIMGMKSNPGYMLKFEAENYAPVLSRVIKDDEGDVQLDVALNRAESLAVTVLLPDGRPAADIEVGLIAPGRDLRLTPGGFSRWNSQSTGGLLQTDVKGQVKLPHDDEVQSVIAASKAGFAQTTPAELRAHPQLQLQPWGRVEGVYASGPRAADRKMSLGPLKLGTPGLQFDFQAYQVVTDSEGRFAFPQVPPGTWKLIRLVPETMTGGATSWRHEPVQEIEVTPGQTLSLTVGAGTRGVSARIRFPAGFQRPPGARVFAAIHTPYPKPPAEIQNDQAALQKWFQTPEIRALADKARGYPLQESQDGAWTADEVAPGQYVITVGFMVAQPDPNTKPLAAEAPVIVTDGTDVLDLGELALQPVN